MTTFMRIRLWARHAPPWQVGLTVVVSVLMAVALIALVLPGGDGHRSVLAAGASGGDGTGTAGASADGKGGDTTGQTGGAGGGAVSAGTATGGTSTGGPSAGGTSTKTGAGVAGTATGRSTAGGAVALTASDVGITPTTIKLGFLIAQVGGLDQAGFALGLRTDMEAVIKAYVDDVNAKGGIGGRKVIFVTTKVDPLSSSSQRAACLSMTEDQKVFAVLDSASTLGAAELCYGAEHHTPYFDTGLSTVNAAYVKKSFPYQVSTAQDGSRQVINWARYVGDRGVFTGHKVGVLSDDCAPDPDIVNQDLRPALARYKVDPYVVLLSCDSSTAQQQIPNAVLQMRTAGVDLVFPGTIFTNVQLFLQNADAQQWHPKYSASDFYGMSLDLFTANFPTGQWGGTQAVTASHGGEVKAGKPLPPPIVGCNHVLQKESVPPIADYGKDAEALVHCDSVRLVVAAMNKAGANPTRLSWANAVQSLGVFDSGFSASSTFRPGKTEGADSLALAQWGSDCKCYTQIRGHDQAAYA
jgi:ABC-type branched-subunit amino acid transport system substrate-binding protein